MTTLGRIIMSYRTGCWLLSLACKSSDVPIYVRIRAPLGLRLTFVSFFAVRSIDLCSSYCILTHFIHIRCHAPTFHAVVVLMSYPRRCRGLRFMSKHIVSFPSSFIGVAVFRLVSTE